MKLEPTYKYIVKPIWKIYKVLNKPKEPKEPVRSKDNTKELNIIV